MKSIIYFLAVLLLFSCKPREQKINPEDIKGSWAASEAVMFTSLDVSDSSILVGNRADTIFTVRYSISHDTLITYAPFTNQQFKNKILLLTKDTLVLDGIMNVKEERHYSRDKMRYSKMYTDSIKMLRDDSQVTILIDHNLYSRFHTEQKKAFEYWYYDTAYYLQRIKAQTQNHPIRKLVVPNELKRAWIPVYSIDSIFYVQKDNDAQFRFDVNDSTFNFFNGMIPVEPYVIDNIMEGANDFEIATRASEKIIWMKVPDTRTIYAVKFNDRCFFVTPFNEINRFPIIVVRGKLGATTIEDWIELDKINCE